jgi:putative ABC transport system substrate-binding protein
MTESIGKRLELLREVAPRARRIACLTNPEDALGTQQLQTAQQAGKSVGMQVVELDARNEAQLRKALAQLSRSGFDGILITAVRGEQPRNRGCNSAGENSGSISFS